MRTISLLFVPLVLAVTACSPGDTESRVGGAAQDSAGVTIIKNPAADRPMNLTAVPIADLVPPDSALTPVPWGVAIDRETGRINVVDWTGARVVAFDASGAYAGGYGRTGDGPGEFRNPVAVSTDGSGTLTVWDAGRRILSRWSSEGELLDEERAPADYWGPGFALMDDGVVTVTTEQAPDGSEMVQRLVAVTPEGNQSLYELSAELGMMELPGIRMPAPKVFSPSVIWTGHGEDLFVLNGPEYRIDRYSDGVLVSSIRRAIDPIRVTEAMAVTGVEMGPGPYGGFLRRTGLTPEQLVRAVGYEEVVSPVQSLAVDPGGRLWVTRSLDGSDPTLIDVLETDGSYVGTMDAPGVPVAFLSDSIAVILRVDELGLTSLSLWGIRSGDASMRVPQEIE